VDLHKISINRMPRPCGTGIWIQALSVQHCGTGKCRVTGGIYQRNCTVSGIKPKVAEPRPTSRTTYLPNQLTQPLAVESQMDPSSLGSVQSTV
jgi:hypothetical protein